MKSTHPEPPPDYFTNRNRSYEEEKFKKVLMLNKSEPEPRGHEMSSTHLHSTINIPVAYSYRECVIL